jgi:hypothetical protein
MFSKRNLNIQCKFLHTKEGKETMTKGKDDENIAQGDNSYNVNKLFIMISNVYYIFKFFIM